MWNDSVKSIWSKLTLKLRPQLQNPKVRWAIIALLILLFGWFFYWLFSPIQKSTAAQQHGASYVKTIELPGIYPDMEDPNYFFGMSSYGADTEVKCPIVNDKIACPKTSPVQAVVQRIREKEFAEVVRNMPPQLREMSIENQIKLEQALGTPYVIEEDGTMHIFENAMPKRSDFIAAKAEWQRRCIDRRDRVKRNRACRS